MEKLVCYQVQFSRDGEAWEAFSSNRKCDVFFTLEEARTAYNHMVEFHGEIYTENTHHRIVKFSIEKEVIE